MGINLGNIVAKINVRKSDASRKKEESIAHRSATLLNSQTSFAITEAYKSARTNIIFSLSGTGNGCKKVIVTSANPGEGKTTTCLNIAITFAQTGAKVLVIDADLRKPRIYRHLGLERKNGLSDVLCGLIDISTAIHHCSAQNIDCITSGQIPPNPAELLSSKEMGIVLDTLSQNYDYIFIDTPPVTMVTEAAAMAKFVHGVIVVARQNYTIHEMVAKAREALEFADAKILGFILNDVNPNGYGYGRLYSYRYGYRYRYGGYKYGYKYGGYGYGGYGYSYGDKKSEMNYRYGEKPDIKKETTPKLKQDEKRKDK